MTFQGTINNWDFPVELMPTPHAVTGEPLPNSNQVVRTDTNEVLGVHGGSYKMVSNHDVVQPILDGIEAANLSKDREVTIQSYDGGRRLRGQVKFPDLVVEPSVGDIVSFRIRWASSHDGSWAYSIFAEGLRLWCDNGCVTADKAATYTAKHTSGLNADASASKVLKGFEIFQNQKEIYQEYMAQNVYDDQVISMFKKSLAKRVTPSKVLVNEFQLDNLIRIWREEKATLGSNKWALYNCLTHWSTHTQDSKRPHVTRHNREAQVQKLLGSSLWQELVL